MNVILCESAKKSATTVKAKTDTRKTLVDMGYENVVLFYNGHPKPVILLEIVFGCLRTFAKAGKGDQVFFQYPYYSKLVHQVIFKLLSAGRRIKGYKVCMLIHDVMAMRSEAWMTEEGMNVLGAEVNAWRWVDRVICHSENMRAVFQKVSDYDRYSVLGSFDYLYDGPVCARTYSDQPVVMFAGNLNRPKCGFIYKLRQIEGVRFDLFGPRWSGEQTQTIHHRGVFPPEELILHLDGQFGLVWDGDLLETCGGYFGDYLKYNSPYKFSLYLAAGVPVIVWSESALAAYVERNDIGITIHDLRQLRSKLAGISEAQYMEMAANVNRIRAGIIRGQQLKNALR